MKKLIFGMAIYFALFAVSAIVGNAQVYFATGEQCVQALQNGTLVFYEPKANNLFRPINPATEVRTYLEEDECQQMIVDKSRNMRDFYWIGQRKGTEMVKELNGLTMKRRYSCGNPIGARMQVPVLKPEPTPTPVPVATPIPPPMCANRNLTIAQARENGFIIRGEMCELEQPKPPEEVDCPECPKDIKITPYASMKTRIFGGLLQTGISAGAGCATAGLIGKSWEDCLVRGALPSTLAGRTVQFANPSPDSVRVRADGTTKTFKRGKGGAISKDCELFWEGNVAVVKCGEQECQRMPLFKNFNMTVIAVGGSSSGSSRTPVKSQPSTSIPTPPRGPNGRILGFDAGGTSNGSGAGSAQPNSAIGFSCPANYTPMLLKGERICSPN